MITTKTTEVFSLSDDNKKVIKENAQKIKSHLVACGYDSCEDFIDCNDYDYWTFAEETLKDFLPFVAEEIDYIDEDDAIIDFLDDKYSKEELIEKIIEFDNDEFLKILFNK